MENAYYNELLEQLAIVQSNEPLMKALEKKMPNKSKATNYDTWIESSLEFLRENENLFVANIDLSIAYK